VTLAVIDSTSGRDAADRWKQRTIAQSGCAAKTQNRSFDAAGRLATQSGLGLSSAGSYSYDANSGLKSYDYLPLALGGTLASSYTYYPGGALATSTTNGIDGSFTFDEVGNLVTDTESDTGTTVFTCDPANRLTQTELDGGDGGAIVTTYYGWDASNAWRTCQGPVPSPTPANEPIVFTYTAQGRLATYANADTATSAVYTYDGSGQRTKSEVTVAGTTTTTLFAYEGLTLMSLSATQGATSWRVDYLCDEEGTPFGGVYRSPATSTTPKYFTLVTNDRGDALELCDADGAAFAAYRYDAWGLPQGAGSYATGVWTQSTSLVTSTLAGQIASRQVLRYAGYAWDAESALYYCSARSYDPATRQWTSGDPAKADGEESAYQYCGGDPVGMVDIAGDYPGPSHWPRATLREKALNFAKLRIGRPKSIVYNWSHIDCDAWCVLAVSFFYDRVGSYAFNRDKLERLSVLWGGAGGGGGPERRGMDHRETDVRRLRRHQDTQVQTDS